MHSYFNKILFFKTIITLNAFSVVNTCESWIDYKESTTLLYL